MGKSRWFLLAGGLAILTYGLHWQSTHANPPQEGPPAISLDRIRADIKYLSSDQLQGRGIGSRGEELAIDHIASAFKKAGLKPAGDKGTFYQAVPLVMVTTGPKATLAMSKGAET